jgi:curved DNA-binding protein CbpA
VANPIDLEKLCQGVKAWNAWRETCPDVLPDLTDANLTLSQRQFGPTAGGPINLSGANLAGAALRYATLSGADLEDAILAGADLVHARLDGANLTGADLTDAICDNADLADAKLDDAVLTGASFANVRNLTEAQIAFAHGDATTRLPAAILPPAAWFPGMEDSIYPEYPVPEQMVDEDLYEVLGVARTAKQEDVRAAFRNLVKKLHPDVNPDDDAAQESFKKVSIAYRILNDPEKRVRYDKGEIGSDGEVNPEFEAKRQFRRYAFRFYAAAAMALALAVGVLGVVWHAVLTDDGVGSGRVEIAVATPPKSRERLDAERSAVSELKVDFKRQPQLAIADPAEDAGAAKTEILDGPSLGKDQPGEASRAAAEGTKAEGEAGQATGINVDATDSAATAERAAVVGVGDAFGKQASLQAEPAGNDLPDSRATENPAESPDTAGNAQPDLEREAPPAFATEPAQQFGAAGQQATQIHDNSGGAAEPAPVAPSAPATQNAVGQSPEPPSASPPPGTDAVPAAAQSAPPPREAKVTTRPLFEENKGEQARPAQADAARGGAPATQAPVSSTPGGAGIPFADRAQPKRNDAFMPKMEGRTGASDAISALFGQRAVRQAMAREQQQATASTDPLASREELDGQEEIRDVYTHSLPNPGAAPPGAWTEFGKAKESARREVRPAARDVIAKVPAPENRPAPASNRKQAVSDVLAGGL